MSETHLPFAYGDITHLQCHFAQSLRTEAGFLSVRLWLAELLNASQNMLEKCIWFNFGKWSGKEPGIKVYRIRLQWIPADEPVPGFFKKTTPFHMMKHSNMNVGRIVVPYGHKLTWLQCTVIHLHSPLLEKTRLTERRKGFRIQSSFDFRSNPLKLLYGAL